MQVTEVTSASKLSTVLSQITQEQLQQEFNFLRAEHLTKTMLNRGLITPDEYRLIMAENMITFRSNYAHKTNQQLSGTAL